MAAGITLTLYGRAWCHLCDDMLAALGPLEEEYGFAVEVIDVDQHPQLEERFGELVPVLAHGAHQLCHYFLDVAAVRAYLLKLR